MPVRGKGYLGFQPFFPAWNRLFRSWIVIHSGLRFFVKWEINFHSMWPRKMMENPPPPPLYHPCRSPWRVLTAFSLPIPRACVILIHRKGDLTKTSTANLVPRVFGLLGQRDNAAQKARIRSEDDPKTTRRLFSAKNRSCGYGIRDCEQWGTTYILMALVSLFLWSFGKKSC